MKETKTKRPYVKPGIAVYEVETENILAGSGSLDSGSYKSGFGGWESESETTKDETIDLELE